MTISLPLRRQSKGENIAGWMRTNFSPISQFRKCHSPVAAVGHYQPDHVTQAYWKDKPRLDGLGAFRHQRWNSMCCVHFILPNMTDKGKAAIPKLANVPHYQTSLSQIRLQADSFWQAGGFISFKIYQPDRDYSNRFLHVTNSSVPGISKLDWDGVAKLAHNDAKRDKKRQHKYKDFGTTGGSALHKLVLRWGLQNLVRSWEQMAFALSRWC